MNEIKNFVEIHKNRLPADTLNLIKEEYFDCSDWRVATTVDGLSDLRVCSSVAMSDVSTIGNSDERKKIDKCLFETFSEVALEYQNKFSTLPLRYDTGYDLLRYISGGKYDYHYDEGEEVKRVLSVVSCLSSKDEYSGGELEFLCGLNLKLDLGDIVLFPSNFMFKHRVRPVDSGTRYSIVTWFF